MTYKQFLKALRQTPRTWYLNGFKVDIIRLLGCDGLSDCPLSAVAGTTPQDAETAIAALKLSPVLGHRIMRAADDLTHSTIRRDLLRATGLQERRRR